MESKDSAYSNLWNLTECLDIETFFLYRGHKDISFLGERSEREGVAGSNLREVMVNFLATFHRKKGGEGHGDRGRGRKTHKV